MSKAVPVCNCSQAKALGKGTDREIKTVGCVNRKISYVVPVDHDDVCVYCGEYAYYYKPAVEYNKDERIIRNYMEYSLFGDDTIYDPKDPFDLSDFENQGKQIKFGSALEES